MSRSSTPVTFFLKGNRPTVTPEIVPPVAADRLEQLENLVANMLINNAESIKKNAIKSWTLMLSTCKSNTQDYNKDCLYIENYIECLKLTELGECNLDTPD